MNNLTTHTPRRIHARRKISGIHILVATSFITILFLAYIDEGYFSFQWMKDIGNWVAVVLFTACLFLLQWGVYALATNLIKIEDTVANSSLISAVTLLAILPAITLILYTIIGLITA